MMTEIVWEDSFIKKLKKLIKIDNELKFKVQEKVKIFCENQFESSLKTHKLHGKLKDYWAFSIDYNYRIVFRYGNNNKVYLINIGSHDEVY
jgi:addiction module RelE/StbE family toxin